MRELPPPRASGLPSAGSGDRAPTEYAGFGLSPRAEEKKRAGAPPGDYRPISSRLPLVAIHLSAGPANLVSIGFARAIPISAGPGGFRRRTAARPRPPLRDILLAAAVDMSKRRIRRGPPAHKAAQLPAFSVHLAGRITPCGASSVRRENLLIFASIALIRRFARRGRRQTAQPSTIRPVEMPGAEQMALVEARDIVKRFGSLTAVDGISFAVDRAEVVGFLGPNGAGKSTAMKIISGFLEPTSGQAFIEGYDSQTQPMEARRCLGYLPEGAPAYGDMSVADFLGFIAAMHGLSKRQANDRLAELVERIDLADVWNQRIEQLSKGFKRRVGIAQALVHDPDVLILDEPTDGLDPNQKHEMRELIRSIAPQKAIVISTHILEEVEAVCTRAIIIAKGRMLADATPAELLARPHETELAVTIATADPRKAIEIISTQPGVSKVYVAERIDGVTRLLVHAPQNRPTAAELAGILGRSNIVVSEMFLKRASLEDVFREITNGSRN
jgi:ABC-2 type transport system ATP-binding protein